MMNKTITVENNQVIITDVDGTKIVQPYQDKVNAEYVIHTYTSVTRPRYLYKKDDIVRVYREAGDELGVSVASFKKMLNGAIYRAYIADNKDLHNRLSFHRNRGTKALRHPGMVAIVNARAKDIRHFMSDNNVHTSAFGLFFKDTQQAKQELGKGLWKALCANARTRNDTIMRILRPYGATTELVRAMNSIPSTLLTNMHDETLLALCRSEVHNIVSKILTRLNRPLCRIEDSNISSITTTITDTHRMVDGFNPRWSLTRIYEEHQRAIMVEATKDAPKEEFECAGFLPDEITKDGFIATLCRSPYDVVLLGASEHHCVGSYRTMIEDFQCVVYKVVDSGDVVSTLSVSHPAVKNRSAIQHMYAWNVGVKDIGRIQFAKHVVNKVQHAMLEDGVIPLVDKLIIPPLNGPGVHIDLEAPAAAQLLDDDNIPF